MAVVTFTKETKKVTVHRQLDNKSALTYLLKMGLIQKLEMIKIYKDIWTYLLAKNVSITGKNLPSKIELYSRPGVSVKKMDSSEWKLSPKIFEKKKRLCKTYESWIICIIFSTNSTFQMFLQWFLLSSFRQSKLLNNISGFGKWAYLNIHIDDCFSCECHYIFISGFTSHFTTISANSSF